MRTLLLAVACGLLATAAHAQSFQGGLRGTVKDAQGGQINNQANNMRMVQFTLRFQF